MAGPNLSPAGLTIQTFDQCLTELATAVENALGASVGASDPTTVIGILDGIIAQLDSLIQEAIQGVYFQQTLDGASGEDLDKFVFPMLRKTPTQSLGAIRFHNTSLATISIHVGSLFQIQNTAFQFVIGAGFSVAAGDTTPDVPCYAVATGPTPVNSGQTWQWVSAFTGSNSIVISNPDDGVTGTDVEDDSALKLRFTQSFSLPGSGTLDAIRAALRTLINVQQVSVFENDGDTPGITSPVTIAGLYPHSFVSVLLGTETASSAAQVLWLRKPIGIATFGNTNADVTDSEGYPHTMRWQTAAALPCYVTVHLAGPAALSNSIDAIQAAIVAYFMGDDTATPPIPKLTMAQPALFNRIYAAISDQAKDATDITLTIGTAPSPSGTSNIVPAYDHYCTAINAHVLVTVN